MDYFQLLEDDILEKIVHDHLPTFFDRIQFSLVCKSWNSIALRHPRRLPGLLSLDDTGVYQFFPFSMTGVALHRYHACPSGDCEPGGEVPLDYVICNSGHREYTEKLPRVSLPVVYHRSKDRYQLHKIKERHIVACLDGWLLVFDPRPTSGPCRSLHLLNPITRATIALPLLPSTMVNPMNDTIIKAVLSSSPDNVNHVDCHAIVLLQSRPYLAWCKVLGEGRGWKFFSDKIFETQPSDVSYYGETLYVLDYKNVYVIRDLIVTSSHRNSSVRAVSLPSLNFSYAPHRLAPDLAGQLLIINSVRSVKSLHKLVVSSSGDYTWEKMTGLDGYAVFVGTHQSFSLTASNDDHHNGIVIANRIYSPGDVFDLEFYLDFWFLPMQKDVIGEHMKSEEKGFSYWTEDDEKWQMTDRNVCEGNRFQALLSTEDDDANG